jgi:hypothetical protein
MFYKLQKTSHFASPPKILALNDDWRTQGDWIDRYGCFSCVLCAQAGGGFDLFGGYRLEQMKSVGLIGRNFKQKDDQLRRWVHWLESNDRRVLQCKSLGGRKQAEWDDHKENYPLTLDGPHIYGIFKVPKGKYLLSLYFFNKDGHDNANRLRDYIVTIKTAKLRTVFWTEPISNSAAVEDAFKSSDNCTHSRVHDFWGGVYKRFYCQVDYDDYVLIRVNASYSFNTIVSGIFFDPVDKMKLQDGRDDSIKPRETIAWEEVIGNIEPQNWWSIKSLDFLLHQREKKPIEFYVSSRPHLLMLARFFVEFKKGDPVVPQDLNLTTKSVLVYSFQKRWEATDKDWIKPDVADMIKELQLFDANEKIFFGEVKHGLFNWQERTKLGRQKSDNFQWNANEFHKFLNEGKVKQTW